MQTNSHFIIEQVAEIKLSYSTNVRASSRPKISRSHDAYSILRRHWSLEQIELREEFKILLVNRANRVLGLVDISVGGISGTVADPKLIFSAALKANASSIVLAHNHPSGNLEPSQADLNLTKKCHQAGAESLQNDHSLMTTMLDNAEDNLDDLPKHVTTGLSVVLKQLRKEKGLTQHDMVDRSGLSLRMISELERGNTQPSLVSLFRLAHGLGITIEVLIDRLVTQMGENR